jgi:hypothetical protein
MINTPTGDVEAHLARRIVALRPTDFVFAGSGRNLWLSRELPPDGVVGVGATSIELTTGRNAGSNTDSQRAFDLQVLHRFDTARGKDEMKRARERATNLYDAIHRSGDFFDSVDKLARYIEVVAIDVPVFLEDRYWSFNVTMLRDG